MGIREDDSLAFALQAVAGATLSTQVLVVITTISSILSLLKVTENMVHPGGFEPPTARFVAEYSIQLSYGCIGRLTLLQILILLLKPYQVRDGASGRITRLRLTLQVVAKATLSSLVLNLSLQLHSITAFAVIKERYGASGRIRTSDRSVRSRVLYPAELRMQNGGEAGIRTPDAAFDRILP